MIRSSRRARAFTLIELTIVVAIIGILAVLAIYGVRRYMGQAKSAEARNALGRIAKDAAAAVEREHGTEGILGVAATSQIGRAFCASAASVPSTGAPTAQKYQSTVADWSSGDSSTGWKCLGFSLEEPQYYEYEYASPDTSAVSGNFQALAHGDLNGDGVWSTFSVSALAYSGAVSISPNIQEVSPEE